MNKIVKGAVLVAVSSLMLMSAGCKGKTFDSDSRMLNLATGTLDGNFNPFFYTSGNDGNILALTQIGMLTTDENGNVVCGEDQACVALDYTETMKDKSGAVTTTGSADGTTEYEFVIKNDIKFSDGQPLTIKDVLFSLYVYLDPAYTGTATIYSTDIVGLTKYRTQSASASSDSALESGFTATAQTRVNAIKEWVENSPTMETEPSDENVKADLATVKSLFLKEATSDWTTVESGFPTSYEDDYRFTEVWQAYMFNEGLVDKQTRLNVNGAEEELKDSDGKFYTTLDNDAITNAAPQDQNLIDSVEAAASAEKVSAYMSANNCDEAYAKLQLQKEFCINLVYQTYTEKSEIANVLTYWATASEAITEFAGDARTAYFEDIKEKNNGLIYKTIEGITTRQTSTFNGKNLGGTHDVLKIVINGVDPKAKFNFGFTVAPLHYYSGTYGTKNFATAANGVDEFGVDMGNKDFFDTVVQASGKNGLPMGAGPYKASTSDRGQSAVTASSFYSANIVYFERNEFFNTLGDGIENAKIKYVNYKVLQDDQIMDALIAESLDFGMPNATPANVNLATLHKEVLGQETYLTGGYGYVGVNPKFIPEYKIRQAIMKAMDTTMTAAFYGTLAEPIYRPMSSTSWAYPKGVKEFEAIAYTTVDSEITKLVAEAGYTRPNGTGVYTKTSEADGMANASIGTRLEFTFTIAGSSSEHPAYLMFQDAANRLNSLGFKITVAQDNDALKKMTSGNLAVWAAAWSSAIDPDPYQVYHKDSKATSVNNWNYPAILADSTSKWNYEKRIINSLSTLIDNGRATLTEDRRIEIYADCLDLIMELAVELPTYQRSDLCIYNKNVIDANTLVKNPSFNMGLFDKLWEIDYV